MSLQNIKIVIASNNKRIPKWQYNLISRIITTGGLNELSIIIDNNTSELKYRNFYDRLNRYFYFLYKKIDKMLFAKKVDEKEDPFVTFNLNEKNVYQDKIRFIDIDKESELVEQNIDIIISFCSEKSTNKLLKHVNKGILTIGFGDGFFYKGVPPFFWEIYDNRSVCETVLKLHTLNNPEGIVIARAYSDTMKLSLIKNLRHNIRIVEGLIINQLKIISLQDIKQDDTPENITKNSSRKIRDRVPSIGEMLIFLIKLLVRLSKRFYVKRFVEDQWFLGIRKKQPSDHSFDLSARKFDVIKQPKDSFYADPFIINYEGENYIFFEDYPFSTKKGVISFIKIDENGKFDDPKIALEREHHLSYPFIFEYDNNLYMMPESYCNRTLELYECVEFPDKWKIIKTIFKDVLIADATIIKHDNLYWLFASMAEHESALNVELHIFYSNSPLGEWTPHFLNPVVCDIKTARPAGNIFLYNNEIYRPSQDCSERYGYALNFNKVEVLSKKEYKETLVNKVLPDFIPECYAIHTYNANEQFELIDFLKYSIQ